MNPPTVWTLSYLYFVVFLFRKYTTFMRLFCRIGLPISSRLFKFHILVQSLSNLSSMIFFHRLCLCIWQAALHDLWWAPFWPCWCLQLHTGSRCGGQKFHNCPEIHWWTTKIGQRFSCHYVERTHFWAFPRLYGE